MEPNDQGVGLQWSFLASAIGTAVLEIYRPDTNTVEFQQPYEITYVGPNAAQSFWTGADTDFPLVLRLRSTSVANCQTTYPLDSLPNLWLNENGQVCAKNGLYVRLQRHKYLIRWRIVAVNSVTGIPLTEQPEGYPRLGYTSLSEASSAMTLLGFTCAGTGTSTATATPTSTSTGTSTSTPTPTPTSTASSNCAKITEVYVGRNPGLQLSFYANGIGILKTILTATGATPAYSPSLKTMTTDTGGYERGDLFAGAKPYGSLYSSVPNGTYLIGVVDEDGCQMNWPLTVTDSGPLAVLKAPAGTGTSTSTSTSTGTGTGTPTPTPSGTPTIVGSAAINVLFNTVSLGGLTLDYTMTAKLVTPNLSLSNQFVQPSTVGATRFKGGTSVTTAAFLAAPYKSQRNISSTQKYYSFAWSIPRLQALFPDATTLDFDITAQRRADPTTGTYDTADRYRVMGVNVSTNNTYGLVAQAVNDTTGLDYEYGGPVADAYTRSFLGDGVQGVLIPAGAATTIGRVSINLQTRTITFVEALEETPGATINYFLAGDIIEINPDVSVDNVAPILANKQNNVNITQSGSVSFSLPVNQFHDPDDSLTYQVGSLDSAGEPQDLPDWLAYDDETLTFTVASNKLTGGVVLYRSATDSGELTTVDTFLLTLNRTS